MSAPAVQLRCPRCGYDLSGQAAAWSDHCPLTGTCPECGLDVAWVTIYHPQRLAPRWSIEHAPRLTPWTIMKTLARTLVPWRFWQAFGLHISIRLGRFAWVVLILLAASAPLVLFSNGTIEFGPRLFTTSYSVLGLRWNSDASLLTTVVVDLTHGRIMRAAIGMVMSSLAWSITTPLAFLALHRTLGKRLIQPRHVLRIAAYTLTVWLCLSLAVLCVAFATSPFHYSEPVYLFHALVYIRTKLPLLVPAISIGWIVWFVLFWYFAAHTYLRLPKPGVTVLLMLTLSLLASACVLIALELIFLTSFTAF